MKIKTIYLLVCIISFAACKKEKTVAPSKQKQIDYIGDTMLVQLKSNDTTLCLFPHKAITLIAPSDSVIYYQWFPSGDSSGNYTIHNPGNYMLIVHRPGWTDSIHIAISQCTPDSLAFINVPNIITINGDGINETWSPQGYGIVNIYFEIRNQDGILMFESNDLQKAWNGKYKEKNCPAGFYMYRVTYILSDGREGELRGNLELER
jgi:gliding motility-associated-like protein